MPYISYQIKQGMHVHPFSDHSGVAFFNEVTTVITSIQVPYLTLQEWLSGTVELNEEQEQSIVALLEQGFIEQVLEGGDQ